MSIIIPANTLAAGGFDVDNSCRFDDGSSAHMHITPGSDGSRVAWTFSTWIKRCALGAMPIFSTPGNTSNIYDEFYFNASDKIQFSAVVSGTQYALRTKRVFRDTSAWYHIVLIFDSNNSTAGDRMQLWINGVRTAEGDFEDITFKDAQNYNSSTNKSGYIIYLGRVTTNTAGYYDGYMSEVVFQNAAVDSPVDKFGEFDEDSGIWKPIDVSGLTFGTNGFYLDFKASGNLGNDANGGTDLGETNLTAVDQSTDTCTNNFSTINALDNFYFGGTLSEGNVKVLSIAGVESYITNTIPVATGKWYWEIKITASGSGKEFVGIVDKVSTNTNFTPYSGNTQAISYYGNNGHAKAGSGSSNSSYGDTFGAGDIIGVAMDLDNNKLYFSKNGTFQDSGDPTSGSTGTGALAIPATPHDGVYYAQFANIHNTASTFEANFGNPSFTGTDQADGNGFGSFEYAVPSGYFALCTKNLSEFG